MVQKRRPVTLRLLHYRSSFLSGLWAPQMRCHPIKQQSPFRRCLLSSVKCKRRWPDKSRPRMTMRESLSSERYRGDRHTIRRGHQRLGLRDHQRPQRRYPLRDTHDLRPGPTASHRRSCPSIINLCCGPTPIPGPTRPTFRPLVHPHNRQENPNEPVAWTGPNRPGHPSPSSTTPKLNSISTNCQLAVTLFQENVENHHPVKGSLVATLVREVDHVTGHLAL
jgi:hypothetical protein